MKSNVKTSDPEVVIQVVCGYGTGKLLSTSTSTQRHGWTFCFPLSFILCKSEIKMTSSQV